VLAEQPLIWQKYALTAEAAENEAQVDYSSENPGSSRG
jgi:hypothetical protein